MLLTSWILNWRSVKSFLFIIFIFFSVPTHYSHLIFLKWIKSDVIYKLSTQCKRHVVDGQTHRPRSCSRKHLKAESNLLDMLRRSLHSFHRALKNVLPLLLHCPVGKLTYLLVLSPYTQGMVNVLNKHDTYADILELLWEYLPLMSLPLMTLLVSEKRSDSWPWGASSSRGEEPDSMKTTCK